MSAINIMKTMITFVALFIIFLVEGCMNWVEVGFNWKNLLLPELYLLTGLNATLMVAIKIIVFNYLLPLLKDNSKPLLKERVKNDKLNQFKDLHFYSWVEIVYNINSKIEAWKIKISKKLRKLNSKAKDKEVAEYFHFKKKTNVSLDEEETLKKQAVLNAYGQKRELLELQLSDEYIKDNLEYLNVRYYHINPYDFDIPVSNEKINKNKINSHEKRAVAMSLIVSCIIMLGLNMVKQLLMLDTSDTAFINMVINLGLDLLFITWQSFSAFLDANKIVRKELLVAYANRNRILIEYVYYKNRDNLEFAKSTILKIEEDSKKEVYEDA